MGKIALRGMEFFAFHGLHKHERQSGNKFGIDLEIVTDFTEAAEQDSISKTVNYEEIYQLVKQEMEVPVSLLEHLAHKINTLLLDRFPAIEKVTVKVTKFNPPIGGICREAAVILEKSREKGV